MKPSWDDAPEWANYLAMDDDGEWYWFEMEPAYDGAMWNQRGGQASLAISNEESGLDSLEQRPSK